MEAIETAAWWYGFWCGASTISVLNVVALVWLRRGYKGILWGREDQVNSPQGEK